MAEALCSVTVQSLVTQTFVPIARKVSCVTVSAMETELVQIYPNDSRMFFIIFLNFHN